MVRNSAFVFIKPHAVTDKVKELVKEVLEKNEISIKKDGSLEAEDIDKYKKIDRHYYAIASKATILTPDKLAVPKDKFKEKFGVEWDEVLKEGTALNAMDACAKFEIDAPALDKMWSECKKADKMVKLGGGFYCGKLEPEGKGTFYVFNGFFMSMRSKFVEPGASIHYYIVDWDASKLPWADFRGKVLGPTDPATAPEDSLRGLILKQWKELDLKSEPNTGDNGVHASASPFEGLAERMNWLGYRVERDPFGKLLLKTGISPGVVREWCKDPQVTYGPIAMKKSLFDALEDTDADWCLALCQMMAGQCKPKAPADLEGEVAKLKAKIEAFKPLEQAVLAIQAHKTLMPSAAKKEKAKGGDAKAEGRKGGKGSKKGMAKEEEDDDDDEAKPPLRAKGSGKGKKGKGKGKGKSKGE
mmetsp:Transcript_70910/g.163935  ORF Transcript_70910/g.163935 Transcript_70910/m.163935 type:complete len:414 (-) Transcript_70910:74-1315(-)